MRNPIIVLKNLVSLSLPSAGADYTVDALAELADVDIAGLPGVVAFKQQAEELAQEQRHLYDAAGIVAARQPQIIAAGRAVQDQTLEAQVALLGRLVRAAVELAEATRNGLGSFAQRPPEAKVWYLVRVAVLFGGDVAAVAGAAIMLGEIPGLAITLALAVGMAPITGGLAGAEAKRIRLARERQLRSDDIPAHLEPWRHLFGGVASGRRPVLGMLIVSVLIVAAVATGVVALRTSLDGVLSGVAFGAFALAVSLASVWNSWVYADDIADIIDAADKAVVKIAKRQAKLAAHAGIVGFHQAASQAGSLQAEQHTLGLGAGHRLHATRYGVLVRTPLDDFHAAETAAFGRRPRPASPESQTGGVGELNGASIPGVI